MGAFLSIVIPYYNAEPYIGELLDCLAPQITDEVEVILIDDGSDVPFKTDYKWVNVIRQENHGVSFTRNVGLDMATGRYLAFIDADDYVADDFIKRVIKKAKTEKFDYCCLSWRSQPNDDVKVEIKLNSVKDEFPFWNRCVWNKVYKRSIIGNTRFNTNLHFGEDSNFLNKLNLKEKKKSVISDYMYFYRESTPNSLTKQYRSGLLNTKRVVYYFPIIKQSMSYLIEELKELSEVAEIIVMTNKNELPQLEKYALVTSPFRTNGHELRGCPTNLFTLIKPPLKSDIVIWTEKTYDIGGIETFIYNFCKQLSSYYSITVLYSVINETQKNRLLQYAKVVKYEKGMNLICDTLIINRVTDVAPVGVNFKKKIQMVHSCKWADYVTVPTDNDLIIPVSNAIVGTYPIEKNYKVIHNLTVSKQTDRALIIVSATRTGTKEKGQKRMIALSNLMKQKGIPFIWYCFADNPIQGANNICFLKPTLDIAPYIKSADYLAQLSDHEGFCYSLVEALELGIPALVTDLAVLPELGFKDGVNGYKIPWEITDDFDVEKIYNKQLKGTFEYQYDNAKLIDEWCEVLGVGHPVKQEKRKEGTLKLRALLKFTDILTNELINKGDIIERNSLRAYDLLQKKFVELVLE